MPLNIRGDEVNRLAKTPASAARVSKTEAVRRPHRVLSGNRIQGRQGVLRRSERRAVMFIDASAMVAILDDEPATAALARAVKLAAEPITSALAVFETMTAVARTNAISVEDAQTEVDAFLDLAGIRVVTLRNTEAQSALAACARYGKGRGNPVRLNLGDCFAYACAQAHDVPLLFIGNDFPQTDIRPALT